MIRKRINKQPPLFDSMTFLSTIGNGKTVLKIKKKQIIFSQGDAADAVFYIHEGKVKLTVISQKGKEAVVAILGPGTFFGEGCLSTQHVRMATAISMNDAAVVRIEKTAMIRVLHKEPIFSEFFMSYLLGRNVRIEEDLVDQLFNSSEKRLARILLVLANFGKESKIESIIPKISQETLADMVGTTRSRISFFMNKFKRLGFVDNNGGLNIHNSLLNIVLND